MSDKSYEDFIRSLSSGDENPGQVTEDDAQIVARRDDFAASVGTLHTSEATLPVGVSHRPNGTFSDAKDLADYLQRGGLLILDASRNPQPHPIVHILKIIDEDTDEVEYEVWIDEDTESAG